MNQNLPQQQAMPESTQRAIQSFMDAVFLTKPEMKERLTEAACILYLRMPDATFGWDAYKEQGKPMSLEAKLSCLLPTIQYDLAPGSICWLGNRPYARYEAYQTIADRMIKPVSGLRFRKLRDEEKEIYGIGAADMSVIVEREVLVNGLPMTIEGLGIIGADESQPNQKGNYKVARELTRDRAQFVRTRAIRDMYRRHVSIGGLPCEDEFEPAQVIEQPKLDPQKTMEVQYAPDPVKISDEEEKLELVKNHLIRTALSLPGFNPSHYNISSQIDLRTQIVMLQNLIDENQKPRTPEPEKPKKSRKKPEEKPEPKDEPVLISNEIADSVTQAEIDQIDHSLFTDQAEVIEPETYIGTEEQKQAIREACKEAGIPIDPPGYLHAIAGAMKDQPMEKLKAKVAAMKAGIPQQPKVMKATDSQRTEFRALLVKLEKMGAKVNDIVGTDAWDVWGDGDSRDVALATMKLDNWYQKFLKGEK